jgi:Spy/CpxP family protein refolding chaperone
MRSFRVAVVVIFVMLGLIVSSGVYAADKVAPKAKADTVNPKSPAPAGVDFMGAEAESQRRWDELNLTPEQKQVLENDRAKSRAEAKVLLEKMRELRKSIGEELTKPDMDLKKINSVQAQIRDTQGKLMDNGLNSMLDIRKVLTKEQFQKFLDVAKERRTQQEQVKNDAKGKVPRN